MTNFSPDEIRKTYGIFALAVTRIWNRGMGTRCACSVLDETFLVLTVYKNSGAWDFLTTIFKIKYSTSQHMIHKLVDCIGSLPITCNIETLSLYHDPN